MWVIEEKAIIDLSFVWFIPIAAPTKALIDGMIKANVFRGIDFVMNIMIDRGANFCHVDKIKQEIHDMDAMTDGNHMWHGTIPSFKIKEIRSRYIEIFLNGWSLFIHIADDIINNSLEPSAWARKYFSMASDSWNLFDLIIRGINDSILISRAAHVISQLLLEIAIIELSINNRYIIIENCDIRTNIKI